MPYRRSHDAPARLITLSRDHLRGLRATVPQTATVEAQRRPNVQSAGVETARAVLCYAPDDGVKLAGGGIIPPPLDGALYGVIGPGTGGGPKSERYGVK